MIRWLFSPTKLNRLDLVVCTVMGTLFVLDRLPWWVALLVTFAWMIVSVIVERRLFGAGYHRK